MNGKMGGRLIERMCGRAMAVILCFGLVLLCGTAVKAAQSAPSNTKDAPQTLAAAAKVPVHQTKSNRGNHEGIAVHGHWTIVVKNPDGTVATRREFENSLQPGGQLLLAQLLGQQVITGSWNISFAGTAGPCTVLASPAGIQNYPPPPNGVCALEQIDPMSSISSAPTPLVGTTCSRGALGGCLAPLSAPIIGPASIQLSGSMVIPTGSAAGTINEVETLLTTCKSGKYTIAGTANTSVDTTNCFELAGQASPVSLSNSRAV